MKVSLVMWALILIAQNASFTWTSRARNSGSDWYHATASVFSNGVWFLAFYFTFDYLEQIHSSGNVLLAIVIGAIYVVCTVFGSVMGGKLVRRFLERGNRRVGHYDKRAEWEAKVNTALARIGDQLQRQHNDIKLLATIVKMGDVLHQLERGPRPQDTHWHAMPPDEDITTEDVERAIYGPEGEV